MNIQPCVRALCPEDTGFLRVETVYEKTGPDFMEYHARITNAADHTVLLETAQLLEITDLPACGIGSGPYTVYRSGRHKNDLPGVFELGCLDERLEDVSAVMAESGDQRLSGGAEKQVISDHLTLIRGAEATLAVEFLTGRDQLFQTRLMLDERGALRRMVSETLFHIRLQPGQSVDTESLRVAAVRDAAAEIEFFADRKAKLYGARRDRRPAVFCTWYYYGLTVSYADVRRSLDVLRRRRLPYDVFQLDEGWEITLGEYAPNEKFPLPMERLAEEIRQAGYTPGLWSSPFVAHETASVWREHPEWILRDQSGAPCLFPMNGTVYYVFDITHPETCGYFRELYRHFTFDWGYTYHKLDFTRAAVIYPDASFYDPSIPLSRAYYRAVRAIREGMGEEAFLLMCGGLYDPIIGLVDAQRSGSDVLSMWSTTVDGGGKAAPYTIRQSLLRAYMNRWWANDPDALMIRKNERMERGLRLTLGLLNDAEVRTSVVNQFAGGGILCQTEPLDTISDDRLMELRHILPVVDRQVRPLGLMDGERFPGAVDVYLPKTGAHCVCLINWSDTEPVRARVCLDALPLVPGLEYAVCDFYSGQYRLDVKPGDSVEFGEIQPHAAAVIKIEPMGGRPIIVASDGHYAMGAECDRLEVSGGKLRLEKPCPLPVDIHYRVLCAGQVVPITLEAGKTEAEGNVTFF